MEYDLYSIKYWLGEEITIESYLILSNYLT